MNHDISHCNAYDLAFFAGQPHELYCDKRDTCKHYKAYKELKGDEEYPISFCSAVECMKENYKLYWEDKE